MVKFNPSELELVMKYLKQRLIDHYENRMPFTYHHLMPDFDPISMHPKDIRAEIKRLVNVKSKGVSFFFWSPKRTQRGTIKWKVLNCGLWKYGCRGFIYEKDTPRIVAVRRSMYFYEKSPGNKNKTKTGYVLIVYRIQPQYIQGYNIEDEDIMKLPYVACCFYNKYDSDSDEDDDDEDDDHDDNDDKDDEEGGDKNDDNVGDKDDEEEFWNSLGDIITLDFEDFTGSGDLIYVHQATDSTSESDDDDTNDDDDDDREEDDDNDMDDREEEEDDDDMDDREEEDDDMDYDGEGNREYE